MRLKANEILDINYYHITKTKRKYFITIVDDHNLVESNVFDTEEEAQALVDEWDKVEEYREKLEAAKEVLHSVIRHGLREEEGYEETLSEIYNVFSKIEK